ncbi:MAG: N-acyl homoserine lactonase family protein [Kordiimonadaceae bacterium]|nr:N-acyl homoserine lactonase family protein [Kordiimonadaceae bacterium]
MPRFFNKIAAIAVAIAGFSGVQAEGGGIKLYALNCGDINFLDLGVFSREGEYEGETKKAANGCFLVKHPKGTLLWDTGLPEGLVNLPEGLNNGKFHLKVTRTLTDQLADIGVTPADIDYLSVSHSHFDHMGNGGLFAGSTFLVNEVERAHMFRDEARANTSNFAAYGALEDSKTIEFKEMHDVFGDGKAVIVTLPGHTPGHTVLSLKLENAGAVLLTGDLYHLQRARELRTVPTFNTDTAATHESMDAFEAMADKTGARVIIQHSKSDFEGLPKLPAFLD